MAKKVQSKPCDLKSCGRIVRMDNPTFPYCHDHKHLKTISSHFNSPESELTMEDKREVLYAPKATLRPSRKVTSDMICDGRGSSVAKVTTSALPAWVSATNGIDMTDPETSYRHRDEVIEKVQSSLSDNKEFTTDTISCRQGMMLNADGESVPLTDHRVILVSDNGNQNNVVVDVATAAPLVDDPDHINGFESGESSFADGINVSHLYEYAAFNSADYTEMVSETTGETIWRTEVHSTDTDEVRKQREIVAQYGVPDYTMSPRSSPDTDSEPVTVAEDPGTDNIGDDMTLDEMLAAMSIDPEQTKER